jgi:hypothetical protein
VSINVVKCSKGLSNRVSNIIRRYIEGIYREVSRTLAASQQDNLHTHTHTHTLDYIYIYIYMATSVYQRFHLVFVGHSFQFDLRLPQTSFA